MSEKEAEDAMDEEDEEINIDFSKIGGLFKGKKKEQTDKKETKPENSDHKHTEQVEDKEKKEHKAEHEHKKHKEEAPKKHKENKKEESKTETDDEDEEEISFDFSKVKNIFKSDKPKKHATHHAKDKEDDEDISVDIAAIGKFFKKHYKILLILIPVFFAIFFRMYPTYLPITDDWAENSVYNFYQSQIRDQINTQYPNLPDANKQTLVDAEFQKFLKSNNDQVKAQIKATSKQFKEQFQDDTGQTYLLAIDPYHWYHYTKNRIENGHPGDALVNGEPTVILQDGRNEKKAEFVFHPYVMSLYHRIFSIFNPGSSVMKSVFYFPVFLVTLAVILAFFLGKIISGKTIGGFITSLWIAIHASLLSRTSGGFADNDVYHVFFPILIALLFIYSFKTTDMKKKLYSGLGCGISVALYSLAYPAWWYMFDFIIVTAILFIIFVLIKNYMKNKKEIKEHNLLKHITSPVIILISSFIFIFILNALTNSLSVARYQVFKPITGTLWFIQYKSVGITTIWPNVLTTVAELNTGSLNATIGAIGGSLMFLFALLGITFLLIPKGKTTNKDKYFIIFAIIWYVLLIALRKSISSPIVWAIILLIPILVGAYLALKRKEEVDMKSAILITLWLLGTVYASLTAIRFNALVTPVFAIAFGTFFAIAYEKVADVISKGFHIDWKITRAIILILFLLLLIAPFKAANATARNEIPSFNDAWYNALIKIRDNSTDAIITSWWDFGHWFYSMSERRVTFDGGDQGRRIHWVGRSLTTSSEDEAIGILRMLNCVQEAAPDKLTEFTGNEVKSIDILYQVFPIDSREEAKQKYIDLGLSERQADTMLEYTHCTDLIPEFLITSEDMVGKSGVWSHFGNWDFHRAAMFNQVKGKKYDKGMEILTQNFNLSEADADRIFYEIQSQKGDEWITEWPNYVSGLSKCDTKENNTLNCVNRMSNGQVIPVNIDLNTYDAVLPAEKDLHPASIIYVTEQGVEEIKFENAEFPYSIILVPQNGATYSIWAHPKVANSIFTRTFFLEGHGLKHFNKFDDRTDATGSRIITWTVDWKAGKPIDAYFTEPEPAEIELEEEITEETIEPAAETKSELEEENTTITNTTEEAMDEIESEDQDNQSDEE